MFVTKVCCGGFRCGFRTGAPNGVSARSCSAAAETAVQAQQQQQQQQPTSWRQGWTVRQRTSRPVYLPTSPRLCWPAPRGTACRRRSTRCWPPPGFKRLRPAGQPPPRCSAFPLQRRARSTRHPRLAADSNRRQKRVMSPGCPTVEDSGQPCIQPSSCPERLLTNISDDLLFSQRRYFVGLNEKWVSNNLLKWSHCLLSSNCMSLARLRLILTLCVI